MDVGKLAEYGRSRSSTRWATNPVRSILWWLIAPYFRGAATSIAGDISTVEAAINRRIDILVAGSQEQGSAILSSQIGGLRKDSYAVAQRIAGLEEERGALTERMASLMREFHSTTDGLERRYEKLERSLEELGQDAISDQRFRQLEQALRELREHVAPQSDDTGLVIVKGPMGGRFLVRRHDHIGRRIVAGEEWEPHVRQAIEAAASSDGIAVDAGAYIGIHTMTMSRCFSAVHAFEPQKGIFQVLCGNLALNERLNVMTHNTALYDRSAAMKLAPQDHQEVDVPIQDGQPWYQRLDNAAALSFEIASSGEEQVKAIALDELNLDNVRLIKVDTQGSDFHVLKGAQRTIARSRPIVLFEWERDLAALHGTKMEDLYAFFDELNYDVAVLHETTPERQLDYIAKPRSAV